MLYGYVTYYKARLHVLGLYCSTWYRFMLQSYGTFYMAVVHVIGLHVCCMIRVLLHVVEL